MMKTWMKKLTVLALLCAMAVGMTACGFAKCEDCGEMGAKGYKSPNGTEYFCDRCADDCAFCGDDAKYCYESLLGTIFVCKDCYEYILEING